MKANQDAYGREIWDHLKGEESFEVVEREDGFIGLSGGAPSYFAEYKDWPEIQQRAMKYARGRVLDIGCGAGRHSLYLQQQGLDVTGIDNSPLAVKVCRERGLNKVHHLSISQVHKFKPDSFDSILMLGNNFGLFGSFKGAKSILNKLYRITAAEALIIAESADPYQTEDPVHLQYHEYNHQRGRMGGQVRIRVRYRQYVGKWFDYLLVSKEEMREILNDSGWRIKEFIDFESPAYIAVIEKN
jgi:SAM-dependent methyltransferase